MRFLRGFSVVSLVAGICAAGAAQADERGHALVLGDSVAFAYIATAGHEYINPGNFLGFADDLEHMLGLEAVNPACPGEATGSFLSSTAPDNGCRGYRANFPLHVAYGTTQGAFATNYLKQHHDVRLITITLGANDGFLLEEGCATQAHPTVCIGNGVPALLATVAGNMQTILADLRATGYGGAIVITTYYSTDYSDTAGTGLTALLNSAVVGPGQGYGAVVADLLTSLIIVPSNPAFRAHN